MIYLLDTNAIIKMLYGKHVSHVLKSFYAQKIQLIYHKDILTEYVEVTHRLKDYVPTERATAFFVLLQEHGFEIKKLGKSVVLIDRDDEIFVKVLNSPQVRGQKLILVTDNQKDFKNAKHISMISFQDFTNIVRDLK
jgi:predicted nucleic acid-binding protein